MGECKVGVMALEIDKALGILFVGLGGGGGLGDRGWRIGW